MDMEVVAEAHCVVSAGLARKQECSPAGVRVTRLEVELRWRAREQSTEWFDQVADRRGTQRTLE